MFTITTRWFDGTWQGEVTETPDTGGLDGMNAAARVASAKAREMDARFGADHQWSVILRDADNRGVVEYFHGRTS